MYMSAHTRAWVGVRLSLLLCRPVFRMEYACIGVCMYGGACSAKVMEHPAVWGLDLEPVRE